MGALNLIIIWMDDDDLPFALLQVPWQLSLVKMISSPFGIVCLMIWKGYCYSVHSGNSLTVSIIEFRGKILT